MIEYDPAKDALNRTQHGVPLRFAMALFDSEGVLQKQDQRQDYGEDRLIAFGWIAGRLFVCVFTWRGNVRRIISLRKANTRERKAYEKATKS
jgi:uncharacterized protein